MGKHLKMIMTTKTIEKKILILVFYDKKIANVCFGLPYCRKRINARMYNTLERYVNAIIRYGSD